MNDQLQQAYLAEHPSDENVRDENTCGEPCHPDRRCDNCSEYWHRMEVEGYWKNGRWTDKGWQEILK